MVFSSIIFLFAFLPIFLLTYFSLSKYKNYTLLAFSLFFYFFGGPSYLLVILLSISINYFIGFLIDCNNELKKKIFLALGIIINLLILFYYKYLSFSISILNDLFRLSLPIKDIVLPIGISFYTFQGLSYIIDVYRNEVKAQKSIMIVALYISMFPQLVAGPIVRYQNIEYTLCHRITTISDFVYGVKRFIVGLFKKVVIANTLAVPVDKIFSIDPNCISTSSAWVGAVFYTLQIYFDFSGYSDMAIGLGRMLGFRFMENFNYPYIAKSIREFWRRWHISLSSWFRDYLYIPLGGNRNNHTYRNLIIVFFMTGVWHGASWNFIAWGLWHGLFCILERLLTNRIHFIPLRNILSHIYILFVIVLGWVLFRSDSLSYAKDYYFSMFSFLTNRDFTFFDTAFFVDNFTLFIFVVALVMSFSFERTIKKYLLTLYRMLIRRSSCYKNSIKGFIQITTLLGYVIILLISSVCVLSSSYNPFIYFRF